MIRAMLLLGYARMGRVIASPSSAHTHAVLPVERFVARTRGGRKNQGWPKKIETRIGGWGGDPGLGGMRVGGPALLTLYGVNASQ